MARRQFYPLQEALAEDINALRNGLEKTLLDIFLKNALPRTPAFVGASLLAKISGTDVTVDEGIFFQDSTQTDGSPDLRIGNLESQATLSISLPSASGTVKRDLIEARSVLVDNPQENRRFNTPLGVTSQATTISNKWGAEVRVIENVTAGADGNYSASSGWVPVALVESNSSTITQITDLRNFYNIFDPDFFSVYGRKNLAVTVPYEGVNLIEVPFEFSDLVDKILQVSVRRVTEERFGEQSVTDMHDTDFTLSEPVVSVASLGTNRRFEASYDDFIKRSDYTDYSQITRRYRLSSLGSDLRNLQNDLFFSSGDWITPSRWGSPSESIFALTRGGLLKLVALDDLGRNSGSSYNGALETTRLREILRGTGLYLVLSSEGRAENQNESNTVVYHVSGSDLEFNLISLDTPGRASTNGSLSFYNSTGIERIFGENIPNENYRFVSYMTENPINSSPGEQNYLLPSDISISGFFTFKNFAYNPNLRQISFSLEGTSEAQGQPFDRFSIKKGNRQRLNVNYDNLNVTASGNDFNFSYSLNSRENFILSSDTDFNDFNIEFDVITDRGRRIFRANILRPNVDFTLLEEGVRTYVDIDASFPFNENDKIILSHIIPQDLVDSQSGTPENEGLGVQIRNLQNALSGLTQLVTANAQGIQALRDAQVTPPVTFYFGVSGVQTALQISSQTDAGRNTLVQNAFTLSSLFKQVESLRTGVRIVINTPSANGFYYPFVAIPSNSVTTIIFDDDVNWRSAGSKVLDGVRYSLYTRVLPLAQSTSIETIFKDFE